MKDGKKDISLLIDQSGMTLPMISFPLIREGRFTVEMREFMRRIFETDGTFFREKLDIGDIFKIGTGVGRCNNGARVITTMNCELVSRTRIAVEQCLM
jgi:hypothetical protein